MTIRTIKKAIRVILHRFGMNLSIDWDKRYKKLGSGSVYDSRTPEQLRKETTNEQAKLYKSVLEEYLYASNVSRIIDFGCGIGRHFPLLSGLSSIDSAVKIDGYDPTLGLLKDASIHNYNKLHSDQTELLKGNKYDLIFIHMVLGGLNGPQLTESLESIEAISNPGTILFLVECTDESSKKNDGPWRKRPLSEYLEFFQKFELVEESHCIEAGDRLSIMIGAHK